MTPAHYSSLLYTYVLFVWKEEGQDGRGGKTEHTNMYVWLGICLEVLARMKSCSERFPCLEMGSSTLESQHENFPFFVGKCCQWAVYVIRGGHE